MRTTSACLLILLTLMLSSCARKQAPALEAPANAEPAVAPVTSEDYARAEQFLKGNAGKLVRNILVIPNWVGDGHLFWYRRETATGDDYVLVDASTGDKTVFADRQALDRHLSDAGIAVANENSISFPPELLVSPDQGMGIKTVDGNIVLVDLDSGQETRLTHDGSKHDGYGIYYGNWEANFVGRSRAGHPPPPMSSEWSPSSNRVLVTRLDERHVAEYPFIESAPLDGTHRPIIHSPRIPLTGEKPPTLEWHVIDVRNGSKIRIDLPYDQLLHVHQDTLAVRFFRWNEPAGKLYAVAHGDYMRSGHFFEIDLETGETREVIREEMAPRTDLNSTPYNPPNVRYLPASNEAIWWSQESGWGHLYLYDLVSGKRKNAITSGDWLVRDILHVDEERRQVYFSATHREGGNPYDRYLYKANLDGSGLMLLGNERADHMLTSPWNDILAIDGARGYQVVSPDGKYVVYNYSRVDQPTRSAIRSTETGDLVAIFEEADASALYEAGWQDPEEFVSKAVDGETELWSVLYRPHGLREDASYPIVDAQYASPLTAVVPRNFMMAVNGTHGRVTFQATASLGFAVVIVDARGTAYRNRHFMHHSNGNLNIIGLDDHIKVISDLANKYAWIDIDRVGIHGSSYGGFGTFRAMFEFPEFYKVGVSNVGTGSFHNMYPDFHWESFHGIARYANGSRYYDDPSERPLNFQNTDNTVQAQNLQGKLLIMMGELDENVLPATTLQVVDALIRADKDFDMIYNPSDNHHYRKPFTVRKTLDFFVRYLHGQEPPRYHFSTLDNSIKGIEAAES